MSSCNIAIYLIPQNKYRWLSLFALSLRVLAHEQFYSPVILSSIATRWLWLLNQADSKKCCGSGLATYSSNTLKSGYGTVLTAACARQGCSATEWLSIMRSITILFAAMGEADAHDVTVACAVSSSLATLLTLLISFMEYHSENPRDCYMLLFPYTRQFAGTQPPHATSVTFLSV
jgi:hypothetical protein